MTDERELGGCGKRRKSSAVPPPSRLQLAYFSQKSCMQVKFERRTCLSYLAPGSGCEYCWNHPLLYSQQRHTERHVLLYGDGRVGRAGVTLTTMWTSASVRDAASPCGSHPPRCDMQCFFLFFSWGTCLSSRCTLFYLSSKVSPLAVHAAFTRSPSSSVLVC